MSAIPIIPVITDKILSPGSAPVPVAPHVPHEMFDTVVDLTYSDITPGSPVRVVSQYGRFPQNTFTRHEADLIVGYWINNDPVHRQLVYVGDKSPDVMELKDTSGFLVTMSHNDLVKSVMNPGYDVVISTNPGEVSGTFRFAKKGTAVRLIPVHEH